MADMTEVRADDDGEISGVSGETDPRDVHIKYGRDHPVSLVNLYHVPVAPTQKVKKGDLLGYVKTPSSPR